jgi:hypothetical protein
LEFGLGSLFREVFPDGVDPRPEFLKSAVKSIFSEEDCIFESWIRVESAD